jgi:WD40 repeat protein
MARLCKGRGSAIRFVAALLLVILASRFAVAQSLYERPILIVDPGMHTAPIRSAAVDAADRFVATGSDDKTVRIWSASDGALLQTIRVPAGPGEVGAVDAVAMSPDGKIAAVGGWMEAPGGPGDYPIYLFDSSTGKMTRRITDDLPNITLHLVFSTDGRYLAAMLGDNDGLRVFDRDKNWSEAFRDTEYGSESWGAAFADDGRLATASYDGRIRLYDSKFSMLVPPQKARSGHAPRELAFSPDGKLLAVGYYDWPLVDVLDGHSLERLPGPNTDDLKNGGLHSVAWSIDGQTLFAAGRYEDNAGTFPVFTWDRAGWGKRRALSTCGADTVWGLVPLPAQRLLVATFDPCFTVLEPDDGAHWAHRRPGAYFRDQERSFAVSEDGTIVDFDFEQFGKAPLRFDLRRFVLSGDRLADDVTQAPKQDGISIENWENFDHPKLNGKPIKLHEWDISRSLAIHPDGHRFVLGTSYSLRSFDAEGKELWSRSGAIEARAVNITGDGRLIVAAYSDGTIRWHGMEDGRELLALYALGDKRNWVAWTPEGFYAATPGAYGVLRWQVNRGADAAADTVPVSAIPKLNRPDALPLVLQEMETARALGVADLAAARHDVQVATRAAKAPGARLHVLSIGVSDYGDKAKQLHLKFANKDASDVANALVNTQSSEFNKLGGLYAEVLPIYLHDKTANKRAIFEAFASVQRNMAKGSAGQDFAVVMFSGHGAVIDGQFYLLPYGVEAGTAAAIEASAIPASQFQAEVKKLAEHGRVLVLLDACHSGAVTGDGSNLTTNADVLRSLMSSSNVTVLTSSRGDEFSQEDEAWKNGAFTKVLIEAFGRDADENHDGLISMSELTTYMSAHLPTLTGDHQHPGIEQRFQSDLFVAGL